ncbi:glycerol-3-phosphate 1-O-acyltransferase PlsB [Psychromonas sp. MME2]|uniref:glycerol-3-phosphate 1-O-acyltransferase PlsB n=1 Tax=Psychromonas sp. MME2 TaxID=3231033 RepID=UPI00339BB8D5
MFAKGSFISRFINKYWVTNQYVPLRVVDELKLDLKRPIIYVLAQNCANDLLRLQASCLQAGLADPYQSIDVNGERISAIVFIDDWYLFSSRAGQAKNSAQDAPYLRQYEQLLRLHQQDPDLDIQLVPITLYWGRHPGKQNKKSWLNSVDKAHLGALHKSLIVLKNGKDHFIRFNPPISMAALCQREKSAPHFADKLARVAMRYFAQQKRTSVGPRLANRDAMINAILENKNMRRVIQQTALLEQCSEAKVAAQCRLYLKEISAHFSYTWLRLFRGILSTFWNHIYHGIEVHHAQNVRDACQSGAEIIYMPCHRSHMDYLLLSYILFEQGLVPPHVAAGVNLNFFPAGAIFRRSGAFFIRRSFKGQPLYGEVFKSYFAMLFKQGYPIEFFTEGGRSRTGRLLPAKKGLLAIALQTYVNQPKRNVCIVPVYIGYDHIMEVNTYNKELLGARKRTESLLQIIKSIKNLSNFGRVFVNFGEPINLKQCLDESVPNWQRSGLTTAQLTGQVAHVADRVMVAINAAAAVNGLPLCALLLLANKTLSVPKAVFLHYISVHQHLLMLFKKENKQITHVMGSANHIYQQALALGKFSEQGGWLLVHAQKRQC